jgi:outer membrane protein assembly factor BamA
MSAQEAAAGEATGTVPAPASLMTENAISERVVITDEMMANIMDVPVRSHVRFTGLSRIHPRVIQYEVDEIQKTETVFEAIRASETARQRWVDQLGLFKKADFSLEPTKDGTNRDMCVQMDLEERRPQRSVGVFTTETSMPEVRVMLKNIFEGRYSLQANYVPPSGQSEAWSVSVLSNVPWIGRTAEYYAGLRREVRPMQAGEAERVEEVKAVSRKDVNGVNSSWTIGLQWRQLASRDSASLPASIVRDFTRQQKAYIEHKVSVDRTQTHRHPVLYSMYPLPVGGYDVHFTNELSGGLLGGDTSIFKTAFQSSVYKLLHPLVSIHWGWKMGMVTSVGAARHVPIQDRHYLSYRHVRGYKSLGPSLLDEEGVVEAKRYGATGGNTLWATSLSLNFPFIGIPQNGLAALHLFANCGNLQNFSSLQQFKEGFKSFLVSSDASVGAGVIVTRIPLLGVAPSGRFEFNWSVPLHIGEDGRLYSQARNPNLFDRFKFGLVWSDAASM